MDTTPTEEEYLQSHLDFINDQISKAKCQSFVWDAYTPAPTTQLNKITRPTNYKIKSQPYFGERKMPLENKKEE